MAYTISFAPNWDEYFSKMDKSTQATIWKKIEKQKNETKTRHLKHGIEFYVIESGQYRIVLKIGEKEKTKKVYFAGNHKQYEKWYKKQQ